MKLAVRLLLIIIVFVLLIASKISYFQTIGRKRFKNDTHAVSVDQAWFDALLKGVKNSETTTTTAVIKTFDNITKNKLNNNNNNNYNVSAENVTPNVHKVTPPKLQQFLPSVWIYTAAHREVLLQKLLLQKF